MTEHVMCTICFHQMDSFYQYSNQTLYFYSPLQILDIEVPVGPGPPLPQRFFFVNFVLNLSKIWMEFEYVRVILDEIWVC
jgi:hypothetical protein